MKSHDSWSEKYLKRSRKSFTANATRQQEETRVSTEMFQKQPNQLFTCSMICLSAAFIKALAACKISKLTASENKSWFVNEN